MISSALARVRAISQVRPEDLRVELAKEQQIRRARRGGGPMASYLGWTGYGNLGDEVLHEAHEALFPSLSVVPFRPALPAPFDRLQQDHGARYVLGFLGGGTLINQSLKWKANLDALIDRGMPVVCLGSGVAPEEFRPSFERGGVADWVGTLQRMDFVGVRGPLSRAALAEHGFDAPVMGDPVFALAGDPPPDSADRVIGLNVGVSARTLMHGSPERFLAEVVESVRGFLAAGYRVTLLPVCAADLPSNESVLREVADDRLSLVQAYDSTPRYLREVAGCRVFVGEKLHATALAVISRVPSVMLAYQPKCVDFMSAVGEEANTATTDVVTADWIMERVAAADSDYAAARARLDAHVTSFRDRQHAWAAALQDRVLGREASA